MISKIVEKYDSFKLNLVKKISNQEWGILDEICFLDTTVIEGKIKLLKKEYNYILTEIDLYKEENEYEKYKFLLKRKEECCYEIVFLASNSFKNIEFAMKILDKKNEFFICLEGLKFYKDGKWKESKNCFDEYFNNQKYMLEHYLISKIYGEILIKNKEIKKGVIFLRKAVELMPMELEIYKKLEVAYRELGEKELLKRICEVIEVLNE